MAEFKGTKHRWYVHSTEYLHIKNETGQTVCFDTSRKNWQYDAQLISKAPELLIMLKRAVDEINHLKYEYKDSGHARKFLKEATELMFEATKID